MDTLTHIVMGACIGELVAGKAIGKRAMLLGAVAQIIPDIDVASHLWMDNIHGLIAHRGITHSLLFSAVMTIVLGLLTKKVLWRSNISSISSSLLFGLNLFTHLFVDCLNAYGTGLFEPFSHDRISFHVIFVVDPFFSFWPFIACLFLISLKPNHPARKLWARAGVGLSALYLLYAVTNKSIVNKTVNQTFSTKHIDRSDYFITPSPLNSWLLFIVIKKDNGYYTAYRSVFDRQKETDFSYVPQNDSLLSTIKGKEDVVLLKKFSQGFYTVENRLDSLLTFNVLRFGQVTGWHTHPAQFAFYYYLDSTGNNDLVVQRGRFENWNKETFISLLKKIKGN